MNGSQGVAKHPRLNGAGNGDTGCPHKDRTAALAINENLLAAHFELEGSWDDPQASLIPLRSLATGPGSLVFETLPSLVQRGIKALGSFLSFEDTAEETAEIPTPKPQAPSRTDS